MVRAFALMLMFLAVSTRSQEPDLYTRLVEAYSKHEVYCDRGVKTTGEKTHDSFTHSEFERCFHRDGRFRILTRDIEPQSADQPLSMTVEWMSGSEMHRWYGTADGKETYQLQKFVPPDPGGGYGGKMALNLLMGEFTELYFAQANPSLKGRLSPFRRVAEAGDGPFDVYEAKQSYRSIRIWVSRADGLIHRAEYIGEPVGHMAVSEVRLDKPPEASEWVYAPPGSARAGLWIDEHPSVFLWILVALSTLLGYFFWLFLARRAGSEQRWREIRRKGWKVFGVIAMVAVLLSMTFFCSGKPGFSGILDIQRGFALMHLLVIVAAIFAPSGMVRFRGKLPPGGSS